MLNDPKKDDYALPVSVLKGARSRFKNRTKLLVNKFMRGAKSEVFSPFKRKQCHCTFFDICERCLHLLSARRIIEMLGVPSSERETSDRDWALAHDWILEEVIPIIKGMRHLEFTQILKWGFPNQMKRVAKLQYDISRMIPVSIRAFVLEAPHLLFLLPELFDVMIELEPDIIKTMQKFRRGMAESLLRSLHRAAKKDAFIRNQYSMLVLPEYEQLIIMDRRLEMIDPSTREFKDYSTVLRRMRSRKHEEIRPGQDPHERRLYKRKWNREYMQKRREDPDFRKKSADDQREIYHRRKRENPTAHKKMLMKKQQKREEHMKDPAQVARLKKHARKGEARRQHRYETDPEYREQQRAKSRERYHKRRAQGWKRSSKKESSNDKKSN